MEQVKQLKEQLQSLKDNDWKFPEGLDLYALAIKAMDNIGSIDPVLRDELIYEYLCVLITRKLLTKDQIKELLDICISDHHLFYKLGAADEDSVFKRTFTVLVIDVILYYNNDLGQDLLNKEELFKVFNAVIRYVKAEKDVRGYVTGKGWAHAMAHSGDALGTLASCKELEQKQLLEILEVIKEKLNITYYVYINEEAERLTTAIVNVIQGNVLGEEEIVSWIKSFNNLETPKAYPDCQYWKENIKNLLRSLYFRLKYKNASEVYIKALEEVQNNLNSRYNKL